MKETTKNMKKLLIALLMLPMCMAAQTKLTDYQFAYFNNNATEGQQVCYAVSNDSVNFTPTAESCLMVRRYVSPNNRCLRSLFQTVAKRTGIQRSIFTNQSNCVNDTKNSLFYEPIT